MYSISLILLNHSISGASEFINGKSTVEKYKRIWGKVYESRPPGFGSVPAHDKRKGTELASNGGLEIEIAPFEVISKNSIKNRGRKVLKERHF